MTRYHFRQNGQRCKCYYSGKCQQERPFSLFRISTSNIWIVCFPRLYRNEISWIKGLMDLASVVAVLFFKCGNSIVAKETYGNPCSIHEHALLLFPSSLRCIPKLLTNDGRSEKWSRNDDNLIKGKKKSVRTRRDIEELTLSNVGSKVIVVFF